MRLVSSTSAVRGSLETVFVAVAFAVTYAVLGAPFYLAGREAALLLIAPAIYAIALRLAEWEGAVEDARIGAVVMPSLVFLGAFSIIVILLCEDTDAEARLLWWVLCATTVAASTILVERAVYLYVVRALRHRGIGVRTAVVITDDAEVAERISREAGAYGGAAVIGCIGGEELREGKVERLGGFDALDDVLGRFMPDFAVFALQNMENKAVMRLVDICCDRCIGVYFLPSPFGFFKAEGQLEYFGAMPMVNAYSTPLDSLLCRFLKRTVDLVGAAILLVLSAPIMLVAAIGVKLSSPGPIIFRQTRVGYRGEHFVMLKFRSMVQNVTSDIEWSRGTDIRKTRFGNFLRRTSLDELPQLINVIRGEMSLVGPRPEIPKFVEKFKDEIPLYMLKHKVKPGMTGLAQIRGLRGDTSVSDRINTDLCYIENWSLGLDFSILIMTPFRAINRSERYTRPKREKRRGSYSANRRILYVASTIGHIDSFHRPYIGALRDEGAEVLVMARGEGADFDVPFEKRMLSFKNIAAWRMVRRILRENPFDAIILNTTLAAFVVRAAVGSRGRPRVINIVHGYLFGVKRRTVRSKLMLIAEIVLRSRTDTVLVMNREDLELAVKYRLGARIEQIRGMGAVACEQTSDIGLLRREWGGDDCFVLCFVGELSARKNQEFLIRAMHMLRREIPNAVLWLVGDGEERERMECLARSQGSEGCVKLIGYRDDACDFMRACDLYVSASRSEGLPFNVLEALSCGKTVLVSDVKGHKDIVENGSDGFLFEFGRIEEFVNITCQIYENSLHIESEKAREKFGMLSLDNVFSDTLGRIKEGVDTVDGEEA